MIFERMNIENMINRWIIRNVRQANHYSNFVQFYVAFTVWAIAMTFFIIYPPRSGFYMLLLFVANMLPLVYMLVVLVLRMVAHALKEEGSVLPP